MKKIYIFLLVFIIGGFLTYLVIENKSVDTVYVLEMGDQLSFSGLFGEHTINFQGYNRLIIDGEKKLIYEGDRIGGFEVLKLQTRLLVVSVKGTR
jgi:hypothetical protein